jgi:fructose-1,6-bisphosphatase II
VHVSALADHLAVATAAAARAVAPLVGRGTPEAIDAAAVAALRASLVGLPVAAIVVASEGAKDKAPMLHPGERFGPAGAAVAVDLAVDPIDGTRAVAAGRDGAIVAIAAALPAGRMWAPCAVPYLEKLAVPAAAAQAALALDDLPSSLRAVAAALGRGVDTLRVAIMDRERNRAHLGAALAAGAHVVLAPDADLAATLAVACGTIDVALGISGATETVLAACALATVGARVLARVPASGEHAAGPPLELVHADHAVAVTGVTPNALVEVGRTLMFSTGTAPRLV